MLIMVVLFVVDMTHICPLMSQKYLNKHSAWRSTSRQRLYDELGWEDLYHRRWFRQLCHFFNLRKNHQPAYLFYEIPAAHEVSYSARNVTEYDAAVCRTARFSNTYFQHVLLEWNAFAKDVHESNMLDEFKRSCSKR